MPTPNGQKVNKIVCRLSKPNWSATMKLDTTTGSLPLPATVGSTHSRQRFYNATYPPPANSNSAWTIDPNTEETGDQDGRWLRNWSPLPSVPTTGPIAGTRVYSVFYSLGSANDTGVSADNEASRLGGLVSLALVPYTDTPTAGSPGINPGVQNSVYTQAFRVRATTTRLVDSALFPATNGLIGGLYVQRQHSIEV